MISNLEAKRIRDAVASGTRTDGRGIDDFRPIKVETGVVAKAEGSATVSIGGTSVIAGIKMNLGTPFPDRPSEGVLMTGAELSPMAHNEFEAGPPREDAIELARVIDRSIREAGVMDVSKLCITEGEKVWMANLDIYPLNADGNLFDAGVLAGMAALNTAKMPEYVDEQVVRENLKKQVPVAHQVVSVTFARIGDALVVDPTRDELEVSEARLTVGVCEGKLVALQKGGDGSLKPEMVEDAFKRALKHSQKLLKHLK
ncbi:MAG TPA: exosome complex protein Rrp42 [archaeon]|nr:exosome complex protein Rrp42 [archaeon]